LVKGLLTVTLSELQVYLNNANSRFREKILELSELCEIITTYSAKALMERLKNVIQNQVDMVTEEERKLMCVLWVLRDMGSIKFAKRADGLAITIQEMILHNKKVIASKLFSILEELIEHLSEETVTVIQDQF
ncbi:MAG: hypothetical protein QW831_06330, partial [Candidatus Jordarchaeaceae archaeon]